MPGTTVLEISQQEQAQMLAALRRARYGYLLTLHVLLLCAAGRHPTEIAAFLFCSRSSVYRIVRLYRAGAFGFSVDSDGQVTAPVRTTVLRPWLKRCLGALLKVDAASLWLVSHALELCHAGHGTEGETWVRGVRMDRATLASRNGLGMETSKAGGQG